MDADLKSKWIEALRSGKYSQAKGKLRDLIDGNSYCCLGVLCVVSGAKFERDDEDGWVPYLNGKNIRNAYGDEYLAYSFICKIGLSHQTQTHLTKLNDDGKPFFEIADFIEKNV